MRMNASRIRPAPHNFGRFPLKFLPSYFSFAWPSRFAVMITNAGRGFVTRTTREVVVVTVRFFAFRRRLRAFFGLFASAVVHTA